MGIIVALHLLSAVIWVGGMFFAYMALRPVAASLLEPPLRLPLWSQTFKRFFPWVWAAVILLPVTGVGIMQMGGASAQHLHVQLMMGLGTLMILLFMHVFFAPYRRLKLAVEKQDWKDAGQRLALIRKIIGTNLILGLLVVAIAGSGKYWG